MSGFRSEGHLKKLWSLLRSCKRQDERLFNNRILPPYTPKSWVGKLKSMNEFENVKWSKAEFTHTAENKLNLWVK